VDKKERTRRQSKQEAVRRNTGEGGEQLLWDTTVREKKGKGRVEGTYWKESGKKKDWGESGIGQEQTLSISEAHKSKKQRVRREEGTRVGEKGKKNLLEKNISAGQ